MRHWRYVLLSLVILFFGGSAYLYAFASSLLSSHLSLTLGTTTTLNAIIPHPTSLSLRTLRVKNPPGYAPPFALTIQNLSVVTPYSNYFKNPIVLNEVTLEDVHLDIEFLDDARTKGNWITLINNTSINHATLIPRYSIIKSLNINNLHITITLNDEDPRRLSVINHLTFANLQTSNGRFIEELTELIVKKMMAELSLKEEIQSLIGLPFSLFSLSNNEEKAHGPTN